ncbi:hypothetical protein ABT245_45535, partial [Streptomyces sp. NPDC001508]
TPGDRRCPHPAETPGTRPTPLIRIHAVDRGSEDLYSDTAEKFSHGTRRSFDAMVDCPAYQVLVGSTTVDIATHEVNTPQLGDERWSQLLTLSAGGKDTIVKQTAVRVGTMLVVVYGSPALVDRHVKTALTKATAHR